MRQALNALVETPAVTIASVSGACLGGGAEIASACDLVLVADDARIGFPEIRLACFPPGAAALLPLRIGEARAADWILTGRTLSGREAAHAGFAARSVSAAELRDGDRRGSPNDFRRPRRPRWPPPATCCAPNAAARSPRRCPRAEDAYRLLAGDADLARAVEEFGKRRNGERRTETAN